MLITNLPNKTKSILYNTANTNDDEGSAVMEEVLKKVSMEFLYFFFF